MICEYVDSNTFCKRNNSIDSIVNSEDIEHAVVIDVCKINEIKVLLIQFNKIYKMGTIGITEGELITSAFEYATKKKLPVVAVVVSGGIRVQEGTLALVQMAKIAAAVKKHSDKGILFISVVTNPTLGGASASFVSLADIIIGEKGSIYGFSGRRIIEDTTHEQLPDDFQTAEYAKQHGTIDIVADKAEIKQILSKLLKDHRR